MSVSAYFGHITAVESDSVYGRHWSRFDATGIDGAVVAAEVEGYINTLSEMGELSDIDCTGQCPCTAPVAGCDDCGRWGIACHPHREAYRP